MTCFLRARLWWLTLLMLGLCFGLGFSPVVVSSSDKHEASSRIVQLYELTGLDVQLQQVPIAIRHGFESAGPIADDLLLDSTTDGIGDALETAFAAEVLRASFIESFSATMNTTDTSKAMEWYATASGMRITRVEQSRAAMVGRAERRAFHESLKAAPPSAERIALLESLRDGWSMTQQSVDLMIDMQIAVSMTVMSGQIDGRDNLLLILREHFEQERTELERQYERENLLAAMYVYQSISDSELKRYRNFLVSETGRRYVAAVNNALRVAMLKGSLRLGDAIVRLNDISSGRKTL